MAWPQQAEGGFLQRGAATLPLDHVHRIVIPLVREFAERAFLVVVVALTGEGVGVDPARAHHLFHAVDRKRKNLPTFS